MSVDSSQPNETWWIVLNPSAMRELLGVLVRPDGTGVHVLMSPTEEHLVQELVKHADPTVDVSVAHGWAQAPEGLQEAYEAYRERLRAVVRANLSQLEHDRE